MFLTKKASYNFNLGISDILEKLSLTKLAGYFQNIVGFNDLKALEKLREAGVEYYEDPVAMRAKNKAISDYEKQMLKGWKPKEEDFSAWHKKYTMEHPRPSDIDLSGRAKLMGGQDLGWMGKYMEIPKLYPYGEKAPYSGRPTGEGYLTKEELLKQLQGFRGLPTRTEGLIEALQKSEYPYFTSTEIE
jgi:hypothetical protein